MKIKLVIFLGIVSILFTLVLPRLLVIKTITCINHTQSCSTDLQNQLNKNLNKPLATSKLAIKRVIDSDHSVTDYTVRYKLPSTLEVYVVQTQDDITFSFNNTFIIVNSDGLVTRIDTTFPNLLEITLDQDQNLKPGDTISTNLKTSQRLLKDMATAYNQHSANFINGDLIVNLSSSKTKIIFPTDKDEPLLIGSARAVLSWLNKQKDTSKMKVLDLRFKNPVIKYEG